MPYFKKCLFLFLIVFFFCGCFQKDFGRKHSHYELGASLRIPENWKRADISPAATISSMAFKDANGSWIVLTRNFGVGFTKQMEITSKINYPILEKGRVLFSKYKTRWFYSVEGRISTITYVIKGSEGRVFSIICTTPSIHLATYRPNFDRVVRSFRTF